MSEELEIDYEHEHEQRRARLKWLMNELGETSAGFAQLLQQYGDYRGVRTIERAVLRMASGESRVSGEMAVVVELVAQLWRRARTASADTRWTEESAGIWGGTYGLWRVTLGKQTKGRWSINLALRDGGFSPPWPAWASSFEAAKARAILYSELVMTQPDFADIQRSSSTHHQGSSNPKK